MIGERRYVVVEGGCFEEVIVLLLEGDTTHIAVGEGGRLKAGSNIVGVKGSTGVHRVAFVKTATRTLVEAGTIPSEADKYQLPWDEGGLSTASLLRAMIGQESSDTQQLQVEARARTQEAQAAARPFGVGTGPMGAGRTGGAGSSSVASRRVEFSGVRGPEDEDDEEDEDEENVMPRWMRDARGKMDGDWAPRAPREKANKPQAGMVEESDLGDLGSKLRSQGLNLGEAGCGDQEDSMMKMMQAMGDGGSSRDKMMMTMLMTMMMDRKEGGGSDNNTQGRAYKKMYQRRRRPYQEPDAIIREYVMHVRKRLGAGPSDPWQFHQLSTLIKWTKFRGFARVHFHCSHILRLILGGFIREAGAYLCMLMRAMNQVALDGGGWQDASLMLPEEDPLGECEWAGEEGDIETIATYRSAQATLRKQRQTNWQAGPEDHEEAPRKTWWPKAKAWEKNLAKKDWWNQETPSGKAAGKGTEQGEAQR